VDQFQAWQNWRRMRSKLRPNNVAVSCPAERRKKGMLLNDLVVGRATARLLSINCACFLLAFVLGTVAYAQTSSVASVQEALRGGRFEEALRLLSPLLDQHPNDPQLWTLHGIAQARLERHDAALNSYQKALALAPNLPQALMGAAEIEYQRRQPNAAGTLKKLISLQPQNGVARAMLAVVLAEGSDYSQALVNFEMAREQIAANAGFAQLYAQCLFLVGRHKDAAVQFRRLLDAAPQHEGLRFNLAVALYAAKEYAGAAEVVAPLAASALPTFDTLSLLADAYEMDGRTPQALETLKKAVKLYPKEERLYIQYAELCLSHGNNELGMEILEAGLAKIPNSVRIMTTQGMLFGMQGRYEEADRKLEAAQKIGVEQEVVARGKALALSGTGRTAEAVTHLRALLAQRPNDAELNLLLGKVLASRGIEPAQAEFREARAAFERVIAVRPNEVDARVELGKILLKEDKVPEALTQLKRAVELAPGDQKVLYQLVRTLTRAGRTDEATAAKARLQSALQREGDRSMKLDDYRLVKIPDTSRGKIP